MKRSNCYVVHGLTDGRSGNPIWFVSAGITPDFYDFLLEQEPDKESYEELGLRHLNEVGYPHIDKGFIEREFVDGKICGWEEGLLTRIQVPGDAAGIALDSHNLRYRSHNLASESQATPIAVILERYFFDMELNIPRDRVVY